MNIFGKRITPKIWLSAIAIGILFLGFAATATVQASNNQDAVTQSFLQSNGFIDLTPVSNYLLGTPESNSPLMVDTVQFTTANFSVNEGAGFAQIVVNRTGDLSTPATVDFNTSAGGAGTGFAVGGATCTAGIDYINTNGTLTFNPDVSQQTFVVPICDDAVVEVNEVFNVLLTNPNGVVVGSPSAAVVTIIDNDQAGPGSFQFSSATYNVGENGGNALLTVNRTGGSNGAATLTYTLADGTATGGATCAAGVDYVNTGTTVTFSNGQTSRTISVPICDDGIAEGNETFTATLTATTAGTLGSPATATVTIVDDEVPNAGVVQFSSATYTVAEYVGTVTLTVTRTGGTTGAVSVGYTLSNGTATGGTSCNTAGVDYVFPNGMQSGTVTFLSGQQSASQTIPVQICKDTVDELDETFTATLVNPVPGGGNPTGPNIGAPSTATITIQDDENGVLQFSPITYSVSEGVGGAGNNGTVLVTVSRTNIDPTVGTIGLVAVDYATSNGPLPSAIGGANCTVANGNGTVDYISQNGTLTFDPGVTAQTFAVTICNDTAFEPNAENFQITLSNPRTISGGLGNPLLGPDNVATVRITDDDTAQPGTFNVSVAPNPVGEGQGSVVATVTRSGGTDTAVQVTLTTADGTATGGASCTAGVDYITKNTTLDFSNSQAAGGTQTQAVNITICDDTIFEPTETFTVSLSGQTGGSTLGVNSSRTVSILDNDAQAGTVQFSSATYQVIESAGSVALTLNRTNGSDVAVSVTYTLANGTATGGATCPANNTTGVPDYVNSGSGNTVNFAAGQNTATIVVPICPDTAVEANQTFTATLSAPTGGVTLGAITATTVTILDDENGTLQFSQANYNVNENAGIVTVTVNRLANQSGSTNTVSVDYTLSNGTATGGTTCTGTVDFINPPNQANGTDGTLTFGPSVTTQSFNVTICDDLLNEPNETFNIALSNVQGANVVLGPQSTATVTIIDNDAQPTLAISNVTQAEGNAGTTPFVFNVTLSGASGQTATVNFATADGSATGGAACGGNVDYISQNGTLTFAPGTTTQSVTVQVCGDLFFEPNEMFFVNLSGAVNTSIPANTQGVGTITNDDGAPGTISVVQTGTGSNIARVREGDAGASTVSFTLTNSNPNGLPATVNFTTTNQGSINGTPTSGTATGGAACTAGVDYITTSGTATFAANSSTSNPITITICGDTLKEPNETIFLTFSNANNTNLQNGTQGIVIIIDDDQSVRADFDRDGKSDFSVFRPSTGFWYILQSINGLVRAQPFGQSGDTIVPGDYDGDGATDLAYFRPGAAATFSVLQSSTNSIVSAQFGTTGDIPVQGDYDGNGTTDFAVFRPSSGTFFTSTNPATNFGAIQFGASGDIPVQADYDGDGKTDVGVYRPNAPQCAGASAFFVRHSSNGASFGICFGAAGDVPVTGDFDGDGKADFTVFRASGNPSPGGFFYTFGSLTQSTIATGFGTTGDIPVAADYDGDGTLDYAIYRPSAAANTPNFFVKLSSGGGTSAIFGASTDIPVASKYQPSNP
ncbi:MAG: beta strand repeat-containing protein [Pyrinomonadaceae bacterium]